MKSTTQKSQELASVFCAWWKNAQINGPEQKSNEFVGYFLQKWHSSTSRDLKKKKRSDGSYLWEHPFGKWCVPQVKDQCVETTHSQSVTDDCERSFTRCPCHRKWRLSRRCTETSRHWQTRQAIWAFGHPFGNVTSYTMGKKIWLEIIQCYTSKSAPLCQLHKHIKLLLCFGSAALSLWCSNSQHSYLDATKPIFFGVSQFNEWNFCAAFSFQWNSHSSHVRLQQSSSWQQQMPSITSCLTAKLQ